MVFLRDRANQLVLGTFLATFLYCLLVLRTIRSVEEISFVPHIAVTGGVLLAIMCIVMLIYFIHHISSSVQADQIIANVAQELHAVIDRLFPDEIGDDAKPRSHNTFPAPTHRIINTVTANKNGYVQAIDEDALLAITERSDIMIKLERKPGQFATQGCPLATVYAAAAAKNEEISRQVRDVFTIGNKRSAAQDGEFLMLQLVEIAIRALVNDPFTALTCLDQIGAALCHLTGRHIPSEERMDQHGIVRVVGPSVTFEGLVDTAFGEIYHYGKSDPVVLAKLGEVLSKVTGCARTEEQKAVLKSTKARFASKD